MSSDSGSKPSRTTNQPAAAAPVPPPNNSKPVPPVPAGSVNNLANLYGSTNSSANGNGLQQHRSSSSSAQSTAPSDRRFASNDNRASPAPPIVVVSPEMPPDPAPHSRPYAGGLDPNGATPPRATTLNKLRQQQPKDTIPMVGKPPRKQRSSRFHVTERVEIERLPSFNGEFFH